MAFIAAIVAVLLIAVVAVVIGITADRHRPSAGRSVGVTATTGASNPTPTAPDPSGTAPAGLPAGSSADPGLIAQDDFTGTSIDPSRWYLYDQTVENGSTWSPSRDRVSNGELQIVGTATNTKGGKGNVAGGLCWCQGSGDRLYGRWQVRARFDAGSGFAPGIGLWPTSGNDEGEGLMTLITARTAARDDGVIEVSGPHRAETIAHIAGDLTQWHTYLLEWRATFVKIWYDGKLTYDSTAVKQTVPNRPMHLYIQDEVGPTPDDIAAPDLNTPAQVLVHVDWVRLFS